MVKSENLIKYNGISKMERLTNVTPPPLIFSNNTHRKSGFTLVELSIVLVIIGLIIGGVLVGQDLIYAANVRAQITQIEQLETAINTFKVKYNCLPGDCLNAQDFFGNTSPAGDAVNNGDGNGVIMSHFQGASPVASGACLYADISDEVSQLFLHLYLAGISKDYTKGTIHVHPAHIGKEYPYAKFGNGTGIFVSCLSGATTTQLSLRSGNVIVIGASGDPIEGEGGDIGNTTGEFGISQFGVFGMDGNSKVMTPMGIPADVARRIDEKIDDGLPSSGKFGIIAGQVGCDNAGPSVFNQPLLSSYPAPSVSCNTTVGKRID